MKIFFLLLFTLISCNKENNEDDIPDNGAFSVLKNITYNEISVDVVIDKPGNNEVDVLMVYHGTVGFDNKIVEAAYKTLRGFKRILDRTDMMIVSVAYPEEHLLFGDNILHAEAALLWIKNEAARELGITIKKIFLAGHSQGGYLVTRLNTIHSVDGVVANAPGPLNLVYRCRLEEKEQIPAAIPCIKLNEAFGTTENNPEAYYERSLLNFTNEFKSDILFVQGLNDAPIQMYSWPVFKEQVNDCGQCRDVHFLEIPGFGHRALFESTHARKIFNDFLSSR
jgi:hypothetical protein